MATCCSESVVEGILVTGHLDGTFALRCARCLKEFEQPVRVDVHELFSTAPEVDDDDVYPLGAEGWLDPEQIVRDALGLELPFSPLHSPDCLGLCSVCGGDRNLGECPERSPRVSIPRWADLELVLHQFEDRNSPSNMCQRRGRKEHRWPSQRRSRARCEAPSEPRTGRARHPPYAECPQCHQPKIPHRVCGNCGYYAGRQAVEVE